MFADAKEIFWEVQTKQPPSPFPVSERLVKRLNQMSQLLPEAPRGDRPDGAGETDTDAKSTAGARVRSSTA
jgi:hypothetical protein